MRSALKVINALLRCTREDALAAPLFEPVDRVPGLWVLELGPFKEDSWPGWLEEAYQTLASNEMSLKALQEGSRDYTLHLTVAYSEGLQPVIIPPALSRLLASCGISLELFHCNKEV